ncbi:hypothetical protein [Nonomuraea sp. NPDC049607]|uniref:hypothetical protein n=1 Tax=Nonomuraea sp. NPDC049607 TaxID=3154732 RepID=UPI003426FF5F
MRRRKVLAAAAASALAAAAVGGARALTAPGEARPLDAKDALLGAFGTHQLVGGLSPSHGVKDVDDFLISLLRDPRLPGRVDDIAVEGGNARFQPIIDRYVAGEDVPLTEVRQAWRDTLQPGAGYSAFYEQLYPLVRRVNQRLPVHERLRVLACDPPADWSRVTSQADLQSLLGQRDRHMASVLQSEVLSKKRRALLLSGTGHVRHEQGAAEIYEEKYPGCAFIVTAHLGFAKDNDRLERQMASWPVPTLATFDGTWLGDLDSSYYSLPGDAPLDSGDGYPGVDAYLYLGPRDFLLHQPLLARAVLSSAFTAEHDRRAAAIEAPPNSPFRPAVLFEEEERSSVFSYDPHHEY